jgi:hypothetical protein
MTLLEIGLVGLLTGAVRVGLAKLGWWPDWESRARKREEHKLVLLAYDKWCENAGPEATADARVALERVAGLNKNVRPVK